MYQMRKEVPITQRIDETLVRFKKYIRKHTIDRDNRKKLRNKNFSILASTCNGGSICHDLGVRFNSPLINLFMKPSDFIKYVSDLAYYNAQPLTFADCKQDGICYPVGQLDDVSLYFMHYRSDEEAAKTYKRRRERLNFDNLYVMMTDRDGCTKEDLLAFDALPYGNKVVFTHLPHPDIPSAFYIKGFETEESVGILDQFIRKFSIRKWYDQFNYVEWLNQRQ